MTADLFRLHSQAVLAGRTLYCSGVLGVSKDTAQLVPGGTVAQAHQAFVNLKHTLEAGGSSFEKGETEKDERG